MFVTKNLALHKNGMIILILVLVVAVLPPFQSAVHAQSGGTPVGEAQELAAFFDGAMSVSMAENNVPGAVVVVVKDGKVLFAKGYGYADIEARKPVDPQTTLFRLGSVSKLFTWTAVMQLVEQGKLSLDEDINEYLDFPIPNSFPEPITLKHLFTHTPGFEDRSEGLFKLDVKEVQTLDQYLKNYLPQRVFPPGEIGAYSNYGTALAGYIVQLVSGLPFEEYIERHIFEPLGMLHATFRQPLPANFAADMSGGYNFRDGQWLEGDFEFIQGTPAGGLSASGLDMARFMIAHLQNGSLDDAQILSEQTARQMHSPLYLADPRLGGMTYGFFYNVIHDRVVISHGGDTFLFHSFLGLLPDENMGLFVSTNGIGGNEFVANVVDAFFDYSFPAPRAAPTPSADFSSRIQDYRGSYYLSRSNFSTIEKLVTRLNPIMVTVDEKDQVNLTIAGETDIFVEIEPGLLEDRDDPSNRIALKQIDGWVYLFTSSPFVFIKAKWQDSIALHLVIMFGSGILFLITIISWIKSFIKGIKQKEKRKTAARISRLVMGLFGLCLLVLLIGFVAIFLDMHPALGIPMMFFTNPPSLETLLMLPKLMTVLTVVLLMFTILTWVYGYWTIKSRVFYSFLTAVSIAVVWSLAFWNFVL